MRIQIDKQKLGGYLRQLREKCGKSQAEVAESLGYSSSQFVSNWERGVANPPLDVIYHLQELYKVPSERLNKFLLAEVKKNLQESLTDYKKNR